MFITKKVFDPNLRGKAVLINGLDIDGEKWDCICLVNDVRGERIEIINTKLKTPLLLHIDNFEKNEGDEWEPLSLIVLELPRTEPKTLKELIDEDLAKRPQVAKKRRARRRTDKEMRNDADIVKAILKRHSGPMQLHDVIKAVNEAGCNWNERSATGHVYKAMEIHPGIKKVGFGFYEYQQ